ncbi:MAG: sugar phosphate nucleotidyltransferase [Candidatus Aenigmarchaeota archaeon]|nr:sugar phosphate nucleotidyltransferase [Candidatus Aenigmarchaeota archaeon]
MPYKGNSVVAVMLVGGKAERLWPYTGPWQSKATLRVAGKRLAYYNADLIDDANIDRLVVPVQFNSDEVRKKLTFEGYRFEKNFEFTTASPLYFPNDVRPHFRGTADAVKQSEEKFKGFNYMLIVPCDQITNVDYSELIKRAIFNWENYGAIATIGAMTKAEEEIKGTFGNPKIDENGRVTGWAEKPKEPISNLAGLGIYAGPVEPMLKAIELSRGFDFGEHVMKYVMDKGLLYVHYYPGEKYYWNDVGQPQLLLKANMELIDGVKGIKIPLVKVDRAKTGFGGLIENSIVSKDEPVIYGSVRHSVVGDHCTIAPDVKISDSVLMGTNTILRTGGNDAKGMEIRNSVIGKYSLVSDSPMDSVFIGKAAKIHGCEIKNGVRIDSDAVRFNEKIDVDLRLNEW